MLAMEASCCMLFMEKVGLEDTRNLVQGKRVVVSTVAAPFPAVLAPLRNDL